MVIMMVCWDQALRDRAHSSPGPGPGEGFPSSPSMRGHFSARNSFTQQPGQLQDPSQDLSRSRERPPLPQPAHGESGSYPFSSNSTSSNRSVEMNASMESTDSRFGFGAIARPELRPAATDFDPSRRRTASSDNFQNPYTLQQQQPHPQQQHQPHQQQQSGYPDPAFAQKFGSAQLGRAYQQQRGASESSRDLWSFIDLGTYARIANQAFSSSSSTISLACKWTAVHVRCATPRWWLQIADLSPTGPPWRRRTMLRMARKCQVSSTSSSLFPISNDATRSTFTRARTRVRVDRSWRQVRTKSVPLGPQA
jgi:hypothetical protein